MEPGSPYYRINCYKRLLQRIKSRRYYNSNHDTFSNTNEDEEDSANIQSSGSNSTSSNTVFIVEIPCDELIQWDPVRGKDLALRAIKNTHRYIALFSRVIDGKLKSMSLLNNNNDGGGGENENHHQVRDSIDVLMDHRLAQQARREQQQQDQQQQDQQGEGNERVGGVMNDSVMTQQANGVTSEFPPLLMRRYELKILPFGRKGSHHPFIYHARHHDMALDFDQEFTKSSDKTFDGVSLRHIRSQSMGRLVTLKGMIVRASDVKPCCTVATYSCYVCGCEIYQVVQNKREYLPQRICPTEQCSTATGSVKDSLHFQTRGSKFEKFQELKIQELPSQVPMGHIPRSMSVHCRGEMTRLCTPGDIVTIDGIFLPQRVAESGYRAMMAGLISTTFLEAQNIVIHKKSYDDSIADTLSQEQKKKLDDEIMEIATGQDPVGRLGSSIAPEIYGHDDIKRALLLQLVGGCTRKLPDGMRIRGDINIILMGDPGVAKSQILKHVASIAPRGVYTTGKGSSGVGLTAAITKDLTTGEMALEGGALVLADQGICCIDEFDKMDESDRTAIHEVMEQQTVSVAKAGIVATLNARAAVLAAANPLYGRYNRKKSLSENVNLPNSLLSRFDLMFLILDIADADKDMALARHVTFVHQNEGLTAKTSRNVAAVTHTIPDDDSDDDDLMVGQNNMNDVDETDAKKKALSPTIMREYISRARKFKPVVTEDVAPYIVEAYVELRMQQQNGGSRRQQAGDQTAMTARQLLSILRLSQAIARLRFSDYVAREDVDEAIRLTHMSKASLNDDDYHDAGDGNQGGGRKRRKKEDVTSRIFHVLKDYVTASRVQRLEVKTCEAMILRKGFTAQQLKACLEEYQSLDILQVNSTGTHIDFL
jgi:DNA replication licensing factor MCM7